MVTIFQLVLTGIASILIETHLDFMRQVTRSGEIGSGKESDSMSFCTSPLGEVPGLDLDFPCW